MQTGNLFTWTGPLMFMEALLASLFQTVELLLSLFVFLLLMLLKRGAAPLTRENPGVLRRWTRFCVKVAHVKTTSCTLLFQRHFALLNQRDCRNLNETTYFESPWSYSCRDFWGFWNEMKAPKLYFYIKPADNNVYLCVGVGGASEMLWM